MERLLRGCIQVGDVPDAEDCLRNWWVLRDAALEHSEADAPIIRYLEEWYGAQNAPPPIELIREYHEKSDDIAAVDRLEEIRRAQPYIRTNYRAICRSVQEQQDRARFSRIVRQAAHIAEHGVAVDKKTLRGVAAATGYLHEQLSRVGHHHDDVSAADALSAYVAFRAAPRMLTGIPALDTSFGGGGLPSPRLIVLGGAPGAGKTSLATQIARAWMEAGHAAAFLAVDEGVEGIAGRICKMQGLSEPQAAPLNEFATEMQLRLVPKPHRGGIAAAARIANLPFFANESASVEQMVERLVRFAEARKLDKAPVLIVDSLQRVRTHGSDDAPDPRQRVDSVIRACKEAVRRGVVVLATSELNRGAYRSKKTDEQVADIAATKESGAIEYAAQTLLILRATSDEDVVAASTPKNRGGKHPSFKLRLDRERMSYVQLDEEVEDSARGRIAADAEILKAVVRTNPNIRTVRELRAACQTGGELTKHERIDAARAYLELHRMLIREDGAFAIAVERMPEDMIA